MKLLELFSSLPFIRSYKERILKQHMEKLEQIDSQFNLTQKRYVTILRDLYDCLKGIDKRNLKIQEDFDLFREEIISVHLKSSQAMAQFVNDLLEKQDLTPDLFFFEDNEEVSVRVIDWYSNASSFLYIQENIEKVISNYINYIKWKDLNLAGDAAEALPFSAGVIEFFDSRQFKSLVSDLIIVQWFILYSNVSRER